MRNILIITQKVDENDDHRGFFIDWLKEFAKNFDKVSVITVADGSYALPGNIKIYSLGKERRTPKIIQAVRFYWHLARLIPSSDGIFTHASAIFVITSWPLAFIYRKKVILWYLHRSVTFRLKLAEKLCYKIVTSSKESLNLKSKKIIELGHGIDTEKFRTQRNWDNAISSKRFNILSVGRISKIKDYETLIKAVGVLKDKGLNFRLKIVGQPVMPYDFEYFEKLKKLVSNLGLENFIEFAGFVPYSQISDYYKEADIFVNMAPRGGIDKAVLEAMASGLLVLVSNEAFRKYFGGYDLFFKYGDSENLAEAVFRLINFSFEEVEGVSNFLVESVKKSHNLESTIKKISDFFN